MAELNIISAVLGPVSTNCYTVSNVQTKDTVIIDPADSGEHLVKMIEDQGLIPKAILLTHGHFDHCMAVPRLKEEYPEAEVIIGEDDLDMFLEAYVLRDEAGNRLVQVRAGIVSRYDSGKSKLQQATSFPRASNYHLLHLIVQRMLDSLLALLRGQLTDWEACIYRSPKGNLFPWAAGFLPPASAFPPAP